MKTPILFLIYNRPQYTKEVLAAIRQAKPSRLFIAADGPKINVEGDAMLCDQTRSITQDIDWPCEVELLFRDANLGCKLGVSSAIDWFFSHVSEGIILEDDCLPNQSFFRFCELLLDHYRNEKQVMMIGGANPATTVNLQGDYFFSRFYNIWGWATWRRAWSKYDIKISDWPGLKEKKFLDKIFPNNLKNRLFIERMFDEAYGNERCSVWSLQCTYTCLINDGYAVLPVRNLVSNIGLIGTHEMNHDQLFLPTENQNYDNMEHRKEIKSEQDIEDFLFEKSGLS